MNDDSLCVNCGANGEEGAIELSRHTILCLSCGVLVVQWVSRPFSSDIWDIVNIKKLRRALKK
jgi:hypothetical protein